MAQKEYLGLDNKKYEIEKIVISLDPLFKFLTALW